MKITANVEPNSYELSGTDFDIISILLEEMPLQLCSAQELKLVSEQIKP